MANLRGDPIRALDDVVPGVSKDVPAGEHEVVLSGHVMLVVDASGMEPSAVELDCDFPIGIRAVDTCSLSIRTRDGVLERRKRESNAAYELEEAGLERALRGTEKLAAVEEQCAHAGMASTQRAEGFEATSDLLDGGQAPSERVVDRTLELRTSHDAGQIDQCPRRSGHGESVDARDVDGAEVRGLVPDHVA